MFVHDIIREYLSRNQPDLALSFSKTYENLAYFGHSLEILLHNALEALSDSDLPEENESALRNILMFVRKFPKSLEIIVNCARKSEMALWKKFFSFAGDPKVLYKKALEIGAFNVATSYLIIIQTLEPLQVSSQVCEFNKVGH